jgi:hypothetical protein
MRGLTISLLVAVSAAASCSAPTDNSSGQDSTGLKNAGAAPEIAVASTTQALIARGCTTDQEAALVYGQDLLLRAVIDATNAYSANTNNPAAMEYFGARNEDETLTVFYNLLWAYNQLKGDGTDHEIEYRCGAADCSPGELAWGGNPGMVVICDPNNQYFWEHEPYIVAHEIWHWLGWGDPNLDGNDIDDAQEVRDIAKLSPATAIQMPHAYAMYLQGYIEALVP